MAGHDGQIDTLVGWDPTSSTEAFVKSTWSGYEGKAHAASYVRSDTCVVPAAGVVAEAAVAWELAVELVRALGEAPLPELKRRFKDLPR